MATLFSLATLSIINFSTGNSIGGLDKSGLSPTKYFFNVCRLITLLPIKSLLVKSPIKPLKVLSTLATTKVGREEAPSAFLSIPVNSIGIAV